MTADWQIHPREKDLSRLYDPVSRWTKLELIERHNSPDTWTVTGPASSMGAFSRGSGCILDRNGEQITTGKLATIRRSASMVQNSIQDIVTASFVEDLKTIGDRTVFPTPSHNLTSTVSNFADEYDLRNGAVETLIIGYVRSHAGDLAQVDRRVPRLRVPTSLGRGGTTQVSGRLDHLGVLVASLAEAGDLRLEVKHVEDGGGAWVDLVITAVTDVSDDIWFGPAGSAAPGIINEWSYEIGAPLTTRAVVAGGGEATARDFLQLDDLTTESDWGMIVETVIDQRQVDPLSANKQSELARAAQEALDEGAGTVKVSFEPVLGPDLEYRRDVRMGDIVGYDLPGLEPAQDKIREARTTVSVESGRPTESVSVVVGTPEAALTRSQQQSARALRAINVIQRSQ